MRPQATAHSSHTTRKILQYQVSGQAARDLQPRPEICTEAKQTRLVLVMVALQEAAAARRVGNVPRHPECAIAVACSLLQVPGPAQHVIAREAEQLLRADCR